MKKILILGLAFFFIGYDFKDRESGKLCRDLECVKIFEARAVEANQRRRLKIENLKIYEIDQAFKGWQFPGFKRVKDEPNARDVTEEKR